MSLFFFFSPVRSKDGSFTMDIGAADDGGIDLSSTSKSGVSLSKKAGNGVTSAQNLKTLHRQEVAQSEGGASLADNIQMQDRRVLHFLPVNEALKNPFEEKFKKDAEENETAKYDRWMGGFVLF
jgi:hypothetical protein